LLFVKRSLQNLVFGFLLIGFESIIHI